VEVGDGRIFFLHVAVTPDDAAAITHDAHDATVLPVTDLLLVRPFQQLKELVTGLFACVGHLLDLSDEAGPWAFLQLVQQRGTSLGICHRRLPFRLD
jgi:hypothetical protein